ncbi:MAG: RNA-binding S4 domain-containing protein [Hyphomicrobiales bacterium]|nr:RNA-binding S4 domain-containing protein [Hyphomicrobiales bacterium]MDE2017661.1 RNA-binding S4 domain-containing protein [Hyphomicrobiales bacterium]
MTPEDRSQGRRLDQWLFFARLAKSRTRAAELVRAGAVRVNRERVTAPDRRLAPGDVLTLVLGGKPRALRVVAPGERRGPFPEASALYEDVTG